MRNLFFIFFFLPFIVYSQKAPGEISTGPTNPPPSPPISYEINIYSLNETSFFNSSYFIFSSISSRDLYSYACRREILITSKNVL